MRHAAEVGPINTRRVLSIGKIIKIKGPLESRSPVSTKEGNTVLVNPHSTSVQLVNAD